MRTVGIKLMADVANFTRNIGGSAVTSVKSLSGELDKANKAGKLDKVSDAALGIGVGLVGVAAIVTKFSMDFEKQMSSVRAATHANATEMDSLRKAALQAGKDTAYSATEAGKGIEELSKAGISTADILGGGLKGALSLAAAGQLDVGEAAETAATAMTQFNLKGNQVGHVADLLAAGAGKAQGSVHDMGYALKAGGLVASQMGLSIEDTTGALAAFASAGLIGSDSGTSFKSMLQSLQNPSAKSAGVMKELGLNVYDAQGKFVGLTNLAGQLQTKMQGLTQAQRDQAMAQIFGSDGIRAATVLYKQGATGIQGWIDKTNDAGYAAETAAMKTDNLAGDIERLKGSLETMAIEAGSGANGGLRVLTKGLNGLVDQFGSLPPVVGSSLTVLAGVGGAGLLALAGFVKVRKGVADAVEQLTAMGPAGEKAAAGLGKVASVAGKAVAALAVLEVVEVVANQFKLASANVDKLSDSLVNFQQTGQTAGELTSLFGNDMKDFAQQADLAAKASHGFYGAVNDLLSNLPGLGSSIDAINEHLQGSSFNRATDSMASLDEALVQFMTTTNDARKSSELWNQLLLKSGMNTDEFAALLPNAYKKVGELNTAAMSGTGSLNGMAAATKGAGGAAAGAVGPTGKVAAATKEYASAADAAAGAARGELGALSDLSKRLRADIDPLFAFTEAQNKVKQAQDNSTEAIKKYGRNSPQARQATRELASAALDLQDKAGQVASKFDGKLTPAMKNTMRAAGLTKPQIKAVEDQLKTAKKAADKYDGKYVARVSATGVPGVANALTTLGAMQKALKNGTAPPGGWNAVSGSLVKSIRDPKLRASGGPISGPGGPRDDMIPAMLSNGEYVQQTSAVDYYGKPTMDALNARRIPKEALAAYAAFAAGGLAGWPYPTTARMTRIPSKAEAMSAVTPAFGGGGPTLDFIIRAVHSRFPGMHLISGYRPGAHTLSGAVSYHALHRAADWPASYELAKWWNANYKAQTKEFISPWNSLNIHNGQRHSYTGAIYRQHSGANAHDHIAMANGGVINEPVYGIGASGRSYSFAENGRPETVIPGAHASAGTTYAPTYNITVPVGAGVHPAEAGRAVVGAIQAYEKNNGRTWRNAP